MIENQSLKSATDNQTVTITNQQSNQQILKDITSNLISSLSGGMFSLAMGLMLLHDTHSPLSFGLETAVVPIIGILFLIPVGNIVDQYRHKMILVSSLAIRLLGLILFALTFPLFSGLSEFIPVTCFVVIAAISTNFNTTAYSASVHELVNTQKIKTLSSLTQAASSLSTILSPALGVALYAMIGFEAFIIVEIIATSCALLILFSMHFHYQTAATTTKQPHHQTLASQLASFKAGLQYIQQRSLIRDVILMAIMVNFLFTAINIGVPYVITNQLHAGNGPIGYIETGFSVGLFIGSLLMSLIPNEKYFALRVIPPIIILGLCMTFLGLLLAIVHQPFQLSLAGSLIMLVAGLTNAVMNISFSIRLQTTVPTHILGRVSSTLNTSVTAIMPIGALIYTGLFQSQLNGALIIATSGIIMFAYVLGFLKLILNDIKIDDRFNTGQPNGH
ncbi:MAG: MFS transporter [Lentilactobacillus diolivorans]